MTLRKTKMHQGFSFDKRWEECKAKCFSTSNTPAFGTSWTFSVSNHAEFEKSPLNSRCRASLSDLHMFGNSYRK
ncbi:hypothetical protein CEXT_594501 [Caerostris extrusa]|uniref:Uncharacterized protein n=1 Tax=Caerostris extrusa TaxID=172846 RepID=A0AAV4NZ68_CAEEX|nr:hypothetical protein CEXT_594501 [Caerostris extrusa]